jgi:imidazoleglycerol phosphate synthase cyclase subunit
VEQARRYDREGADELVFLDITASSESRDTVRDMARRVADSVFIPFTVGGGIRTLEDMRVTLASGADKISVNTAAIKVPSIITDGARDFGSQAIVVAIDARKVTGYRLQGKSGLVVLAQYGQRVCTLSPVTCHLSPGKSTRMAVALRLELTWSNGRDELKNLARAKYC